MLKVMFLAATAHPCFDAEGNCTFDGKIGIWPFVKWVQVQRTSVNWVVGTWETKPINVDKDTRNLLWRKSFLPSRQSGPAIDMAESLLGFNMPTQLHILMRPIKIGLIAASRIDTYDALNSKNYLPTLQTPIYSTSASFACCRVSSLSWGMLVTW